MITQDGGIACDPNIRKSVALLMESVPKAVSLTDLIALNYNQDFVTYDLFPVCLLIYLTLQWFCNNFTHYDLHMGNVLLVPCPEPNEVFRFIVKTPAGASYIYSRYLPKIIDYGRSFFSTIVPDGSVVSSATIRDDLCIVDTRLPAGQCCRDQGVWLDTPLDASSGFVRSSVRNVSHDLRLMHGICQVLLTHTNINPLWGDIMRRLVYVTPTGTPEHADSQSRNHIYNVRDLATYLQTVAAGNPNLIRVRQGHAVFGTFIVQYDGSEQSYIYEGMDGIAHIPEPII